MEEKTFLTPEDIEAAIAGELYMWPKEQNAPFKDSTMTICLLRLKNGYEVIGQSACVNPEKFDKEIGKAIARADAFRQIWALEGYSLKNSMRGVK